jgi:hypothetical protein
MSDHDPDRDRDHANDNGKHERPGSKIAPAPAGGALTSLAALQTALANVNTAAIIGRTGLPMLLFKREGSGTWGFGQKRTIPEEGSKWAINPLTFKYGYICFGDNNKVLDERLVSISQPKPLITELPDMGFPWQEEWAVNLKCISGADAGVEVVFKATTDGGIKAIVLMVDQVRDRINSGQHDGKIAPIVLLEKDSYQHSQYGRVWFPVLNTIEWMSLDGPAPSEPAPQSPSSNQGGASEQPRRRRVA